jgi:hypothetical protein
MKLVKYVVTLIMHLTLPYTHVHKTLLLFDKLFARRDPVSDSEFYIRIHWPN